jgi:hypothetical protein
MFLLIVHVKVSRGADLHLAKSVRTTYCVNTCINLELMCYISFKSYHVRSGKDHVHGPAMVPDIGPYHSMDSAL